MAIVTEEIGAAEAEKQAASLLPQQRTRNTQQRRAVFEAVRALNGAHPTAAEVYERLRGDYPNLSLATVYRALHALVEQKSLTELHAGVGENVARYDAGAPHHHLICRACGSIHDIGTDIIAPALLRRMERRIEQISAFQIDGSHPIQFSGLCPRCRS